MPDDHTSVTLGWILQSMLKIKAKAKTKTNKTYQLLRRGISYDAVDVVSLVKQMLSCLSYLHHYHHTGWNFNLNLDL